MKWKAVEETNPETKKQMFLTLNLILANSTSEIFPLSTVSTIKILQQYNYFDLIC